MATIRDKIRSKELTLELQVIGELGKFNNDFENVVLWQDTNFKTIMSCKVDKIGHLESLRTHFAPVRMWNDGMFMLLSALPCFCYLDI